MQHHMDQPLEQLLRHGVRPGRPEGDRGGRAWENDEPLELDLSFDLNDGPGGRQVTVLQGNPHRLTVTQPPEGRHLEAASLKPVVILEVDRAGCFLTELDLFVNTSTIR